MSATIEGIYEEFRFLLDLLFIGFNNAIGSVKKKSIYISRKGIGEKLIADVKMAYATSR